MKKLMVVFLATGLLTVAGCGDSEKVLEGEVQNMVSNGRESGEAETPQTSGQTSGQGDLEEAQIVQKGYLFETEGIVIAVDEDAAPLIEQLGEPVSYFEAASCAFEGLDKMYTYSSFEIDTYPMDDKDYISSVILKDDCVSTAEGVYIGNSMEALTQAYGSEYAEEDGMIVYEKDGMKLCFILQNGEIVSIEYRSGVLE
ncbi:MAG: hypothetical protein NC417_06950 [Candidatus Gastranaerophilales bacterium]|nr:hypothetical protein [Candidatus Gastranaerophilales bacterium]